MNLENFLSIYVESVKLAILIVDLEILTIRSNKASFTVASLMENLFLIIDPYSIDKQGFDVGHKYRTGIYSHDESHLIAAREFIANRSDSDRIALEVLPLTNYVRSADEHQDHLERCPEDYSYCHIPLEIMNKYRNH